MSRIIHLKMRKGAVAEFTDVIQELIGFTFLKADS